VVKALGPALHAEEPPRCGRLFLGRYVAATDQLCPLEAGREKVLTAEVRERL
jgi:hypothetical protein